MSANRWFHGASAVVASFLLLALIGLASSSSSPCAVAQESKPKIERRDERKDERKIEPKDERPVLEVDADLQLDPNVEYGRIVVKKSGVTIDGRGAWLTGAKSGKPREFKQIAVSATGVSNVTLKNVNAKGWETGLKIVDGSSWTVENCNFSDNFHDPDFGWGENGRRGGIVLERVTKSTIQNCRANRVWDACTLVDSDDNTLVDNDFSRTSNTCLKLWNSSRNVVRKNNLSYGLRIAPNEVHARDSTCVLIESGSNDNRLIGNDCTHGGDGIFVRVLNGWVSTGNWFESNDCSHAHNNCVEAWSPRNTYVRNKANHGSYGFWLGASDQTVLLENEASFNGLPDGHHNSPHLPGAGHAGIVFMFGPSSHTVVRGNKCEKNNGAGIALIGDQGSQGRKWRAYHWIIEENTLRENRWGVFAQFADWVDIAENRMSGNAAGNLFVAGGVSRLTVRESEADSQDGKRILPPRVALEGPTSAPTGQAVALDASASVDPQSRALSYRWDFGDGKTASTARVEHRFDKPGFYRVGLTVDNGRLSNLAWRDFYVVEKVDEWGTEAAGDAAAWSWFDPRSSVTYSLDEQIRISGRQSLKAVVSPYSGGRVNLLYPATKSAGVPLAGKKRLVFWLKAINENVPAWQDVNPVVTLHESDERALRLTPKGDLLSQPPYNEAREGWTYFSVPLAGDETWQRGGDEITRCNWLSLGFDSWGAPPLRIWLDGLAIVGD